MSRSIFNCRFSRRNRVSSLRSSSVTASRGAGRAASTHRRSIPRPMPNCWAIVAIGASLVSTKRTASALNSGLNFRRRCRAIVDSSAHCAPSEVSTKTDQLHPFFVLLRTKDPRTDQGPRTDRGPRTDQARRTKDQGLALPIRGERNSPQLALVQPIHETPVAGVDDHVSRPRIVMADEGLPARRALQRPLSRLLARRRRRPKRADVVRAYRVDDRREPVHLDQQTSATGTAEKGMAVQPAL